MRIAVLSISFIILFLLTIFIDYALGIIKHNNDNETNNLEMKKFNIVKWIRKLNLKRILLILMDIIISLLIALPFNFDGKVQDTYNRFVHRLSGEETIYFIVPKLKDCSRKVWQEYEILKTSANAEKKNIEPLEEFPFSTKYDITFPEAQILDIPILRESDEYTVTLPIELYEYQPDKVPINEDIHGFIVNDTYYCNDDDSETSIAEFNYYNFTDYWLVLHTVEVSFMGSGNFTPDFNGATIVLREKESQKEAIIESNYLANSFVTFQCSTGQYIIEIQKNGIAYTSDIVIEENEKTFIGIAEQNHKYLPTE